MSKRKNKAASETPSKRDRPEREEEEEEEEDEDEDDVVGPTQQHSQLSQKSGGTGRPILLTRRSITTDETAAEVGIVESITLKNFMCHSLLGPCSFGPNVNFVVGNNGSGKSAILTALIVALSGNAQATNRGSSLKGFVKEGESSADVSVTLRNRGKDAYKPEVFGQSIVVDLRITREGSRAYKLKTKSGHIVSSRKEDLLSVLDHFNIQVNNPVSILTQEMSKHFLNSKGEGDKYKFFMKATQLEQMKEDYVHIKSTKNVTQDLMEQHKETLADMKKKYLEKEDRYKSLASLDDMQTELENLNGQMAWALVGEMEKAVEPVRQKLESDERSTVKFDQKVDEWKDKIAEAERKYKEIHDQLEGITLRLQELQPQGAALKAEAQRRTNPLKAAEAAVHRCKTNLRDLEKDQTQLASRIDELKLSISQTTGADSQVRAERVEQLQAELDALKHQDSTLGQQIDQYQQASNRAKDEFGKMRREQDVLQVSLDGSKRNLHNMESSRSNRLRRFGEQMPALLAAIQDAHEKGHFKQRPRGPLGFLISLKEPELALAVEVCLKGQLLAFACDNYEDERVLQGLMSRLFTAARRPSIITSSFLTHVHDTSRRAVDHPTYPSVLQALEIDDPVVANCLIDQSRIECILLIKNRTEARQVMQGRNPPRNCTQAFSKDGDTIYTDRSYTSDQSRPNYLTGDVEEEIRHMHAELENQQIQASRFQQQIRKVEEDGRQNDTLLKRAHVEQKKTKDKARKLQMEIADLQNVEEPQSEDLKPLEEELQEVITKISSQRAEFEEARAQMAQRKASCEEAEQQYKQHKDQISTVTEEADPIKDGLCTSDQDVAKCKHHRKHYEDKRKAHLSSIQTLITSLHSKEEELTMTIAKATEICPERVEVSRTARSLDTEISRLKAKIATQHEQQGDPEEITRQYHEAMESYKNVFQHRRSLLRFITSLEGILEDRHRAYNDLRKFLSVRCKYYFDNMLAQRGFSGSMIFDHKEEALSISVQPGEGDKADLSDMRSLSGGERSFSTVCFVLSLWAIAEAPFRCLDEFDVYMDMVNRRISMDMMLKVAASQRYRQFIFLTPQSMSSLPVNSMIRILRLNDPDRGQKTLPFVRQDGEAED